jgi:hypothetical protein
MDVYECTLYCAYFYMYVCRYTRMYVYVCMLYWAYLYMYVCMYVYMYMCVYCVVLIVIRTVSALGDEVSFS